MRVLLLQFLGRFYIDILLSIYLVGLMSLPSGMPLVSFLVFCAGWHFCTVLRWDDEGGHLCLGLGLGGGHSVLATENEVSCRFFVGIFYQDVEVPFYS